MSKHKHPKPYIWYFRNGFTDCNQNELHSSMTLDELENLIYPMYYEQPYDTYRKFKESIEHESTERVSVYSVNALDNNFFFDLLEVGRNEFIRNEPIPFSYGGVCLGYRKLSIDKPWDEPELHMWYWNCEGLGGDDEDGFISFVDPELDFHGIDSAKRNSYNEYRLLYAFRYDKASDKLIRVQFTERNSIETRYFKKDDEDWQMTRKRAIEIYGDIPENIEWIVDDEFVIKIDDSESDEIGLQNP